MKHERREIEAVLAYWRVDKQTLLKCCFLIRSDCEGGTCAGIREIIVQSQRSMDPTKLLDRALSVLRYLPDDTKHAFLIEQYAFGQLRGRPPYAVARFWDRVPSDAVAGMAPLAAALLG